MQTYKVAILGKYLNGKYAEVEKWRVGEALTRMQEDSNVAANYLIDSIPSVVKLSARILIVGTFLCFINPWMLLTVVSFYPICIYIQSQIRKPFGKKQENMMQADAEAGALTQSVLNQTKNIRAYNLVDYAVEKYGRAQEKSNKAYMSFVNFYMLQLPISGIAGIVPQILLYALGGYMVASKSMTIPVFLMFVTLAQPLTSFLVDSFQSIQGIRQTSIGVKRLFQIFDIPEEEATGKILSNEIEEIKVNDISFSYPIEDEIQQKAAISELHDTDLRIENGNSTVTGGQVQRLGIARAYVRNPAVMIFDEPLSALDPDNAILLQENILALNNTVIEITHRLEKVQDFRQIFILESGKLVEMGTYEQLLNAKGFFCDLIRKEVS